MLSQNTIIIIIASGALITIVFITVLICFIRTRGRTKKIEFEESAAMISLASKRRAPSIPENKIKQMSNGSNSLRGTNSLKGSNSPKAPPLPKVPPIPKKPPVPQHNHIIVEMDKIENVDRTRQIQEIKDEFFGGIYGSIESLNDENTEGSVDKNNPENRSANKLETNSANKENVDVANNNNSTKTDVVKPDVVIKSSVVKRPAPEIPVKLPPKRSTSIAQISPNVPQRTTSMKQI